MVSGSILYCSDTDCEHYYPFICKGAQACNQKNTTRNYEISYSIKVKTPGASVQTINDINFPNFLHQMEIVSMVPQKWSMRHLPYRFIQMWGNPNLSPREKLPTHPAFLPSKTKEREICPRSHHSQIILQWYLRKMNLFSSMHTLIHVSIPSVFPSSPPSLLQLQTGQMPPRVRLPMQSG